MNLSLDLIVVDEGLQSRVGLGWRGWLRSLWKCVQEGIDEDFADRVIRAVNAEEAHRKLLKSASDRLHHWDRCTYKSVEDTIKASEKALGMKEVA